MNRGQLRDLMKDWSQRKNIPDSTMNGFIEIALSKATRALRIPPLERYQDLLVTTNGYINLPSDYMEIIEMTTTINGNKVIIERKDISEVDSRFNMIGSPLIAGRIGPQFKIAPQQPEGATVGLYYYGIEPEMSDDTVSNWFTRFSPEVILYGALAELASYTRDTEGVTMWNQRFVDDVNIIQAVEDRAAWSGSTLAISIGGSVRRNSGSRS